MATILELAMLAQRAYQIHSKSDPWDPAGDPGVLNVGGSNWTVAERVVAPQNWTKPLRALAPPGFCTGVQAYLFTRNNEKVLAIKGTDVGGSWKGGGLRGGGDLVADLKIGLNIIPNQASAANSFYNKVKDKWGTDLIVVGHSLGGALAQVLGCWNGLRFVTFNAPGMCESLGFSLLNVCKPMVMARSWNAYRKHNDVCLGVNVRLDKDVVSTIGKHFGLLLPALQSRTPNPYKAHLLKEIIPVLHQNPAVANYPVSAA